MRPMYEWFGWPSTGPHTDHSMSGYRCICSVVQSHFIGLATSSGVGVVGEMINHHSLRQPPHYYSCLVQVRFEASIHLYLGKATTSFLQLLVEWPSQ